MNLFIDLDGTLLDSKERLYQLFNKLVIESSYSYEAYWRLKHSGMNHNDILKEKFNYSSERITEFEKKWMSEIETKDLLRLDKPFMNVDKWLLDMKQSYDIYLVTARQSSDALNVQLDALKLYDFFDDILITEQKKSKEQLIKESGIILTEDDWMIGDTGYDILTSKSLGIKGLAVLSGFMSKEKLEQYQPDLILSNIVEFK